MDESKLTLQTYQQIAPAYAERWATNDLVTQKARERFLSYVTSTALVLDVGCGPGRDARLLAEAGCDVIACDFSTAMLVEAEKHFDGPLVAGDMRALPFREATFGALWVCASLLHIPRREVSFTLGRFRTLLRDGGMLFVGVKEGQGEMLRERDGFKRFFTFYSEREITNLIEHASFSITESWLDKDDVHPEPWINVIAEAS